MKRLPSLVSVFYTDTNVKLWQALFDAQRDQFDQFRLLLNGSNTRFIHVNHGEGTHWTQLGSDGIGAVGVWRLEEGGAVVWCV